MTAYTKNFPGAPTSGLYAFGDVVTDSQGVAWVCVQAGLPGAFVAEVPYVEIGTTVARQGTVATVTGLVGAELNGTGSFRHTRLTLTSVAQAVVNGTEFQGTKLWTFPEGRIFVVGVVATLAQKTTSVLASTLNASSTGAVALGTAEASNVSLTSTMVDLAPSTAFTSSATINVAGTAVSPVLAAAAAFDGTSTAKPLWLNSAFATTTDVDADATQEWTGTIDIAWVLIGDK